MPARAEPVSAAAPGAPAASGAHSRRDAAAAGGDHRGRARWSVFGLPMLASLMVHTGLVLGLMATAWRLGTTTPSAGVGGGGASGRIDDEGAASAVLINLTPPPVSTPARTPKPDAPSARLPAVPAPGSVAASAARALPSTPAPEPPAAPAGVAEPSGVSTPSPSERPTPDGAAAAARADDGRAGGRVEVRPRGLEGAGASGPVSIVSNPTAPGGRTAPFPAGGLDEPGGLLGSAAATAGADSGVSFAGLYAPGPRATRVVYVVDASGPMVTSLPMVLAEVRRSIEGLTPAQRFGVVLFRAPGEDAGGSGGPSVEVFQPRLVDATARHRGRLDDWLKGVTPRGRSNPLEGLRAALALRPEVVFLLTRSIERSGGGQWGQGLDATLAELERLNPIDPATGRRAVVIKTIQFLEPDPTGIMAAIARAHGHPGDTPQVRDRVLRREELGR